MVDESSDNISPQEAPGEPLQKYSCVTCAARKVKCDRRDPCSNCTRSNSNCIYRAPAAPRRRKKGVRDATILSRLKRAEDLLASRQQAPAHLEQPPVTATTTLVDKIKAIDLGGQLVNDADSSRFLENSMWTTLNDELKNIRSAIEEPADDFFPKSEADTLESSLMLGSSPSSIEDPNHPNIVQIFQLWQAFIENIYPIIKVIHAPTTQQLITGATSNMENLPRPLEALMFSIYFIAVVSLDDEAIRNIFHQSRLAVIARFRLGAQNALIRAGYLRSYNLMVLQAFVIYLIAARGTMQPSEIWILSGVALRMGQKIGLHRDGESLGLPVFDAEIRTRLWWEMIFIDARAAMLSGSGGPSPASSLRPRPPRNVNDTQLTPAMTTRPVEHDGLTEMVYARIRAEVGMFLMSFPKAHEFDSAWAGLTTDLIPLSEKDRRIDGFRQRLVDQYTKHCDATVPFHLLVILVTRSAVLMMRFMSRNPSMIAKEHKLNGEERDEVMRYCISLLDNALRMWEEPSLAKFRWEVRMHVQWVTNVYLLSEMRRRKTGPIVEEAWRLITRFLTIKDGILAGTPGSLHLAIFDLTISAWDAREAELIKQGKGNYFELEPNWLVNLRQLRSRGSSSSSQTYSNMSTSQSPPPANSFTPDSSEQMPGMDATGSTDYDLDFSAMPLQTQSDDFNPLQLEYWDPMLFEHQMQNFAQMSADPQIQYPKYAS